MNALFDPHFDQPIFADGEPLASARAAMLLVHARAASADHMLMLAMELDSLASLILHRRLLAASGTRIPRSSH